MPYESDADVPKHVPPNKRSQWRQVWNHAYKSCQSKGGKDCEASAFRQANGVALMEHKGKLGSSRLFTTNLVTLGELIDQSKGLYKIPIAYTGTFSKGGEKFSITDSDLFSIVKNFKKKENGEVNLDYEHASEMPDIAKGGPVPSAGAITTLSIELGDDGKPWLFGIVGYTELARQLVESKQYRYFSPAIDWGAEDKSTGEPQGATLTSAALTNRPFLEKLPPLLMTEVPRIFTEETPMSDPNAKVLTIAVIGSKEDAEALSKRLSEAGHKFTLADGGKLRLRKSKDGKVNIHAPGKGEGEAAFGELMGEAFPSDIAALTAVEDPGKESLEESVGEALGETMPVNMTDVKKFYVAGKEHIRMVDANTGHKLLSETVTAQGWDKRKSRTLLSDGKVSPQQYAAFENAIELVEQGVEEGKIHPSQRAYFLTDAINRPAEFEAMLKEAKPYIELTEKGLSGVSTDGRTNLSEADALKQEVTAYMKEHKCKYTVALKAVNSGNPERSQRLRDENSKRARMM